MNSRDLAKQYAEARNWRKDARREGWWGTYYGLGVYITALRVAWAYWRKHA